MSNELIVLAKSLRGHIARWAVQQSPYPAGPEGLGQVLAEVTRRFDEQGVDKVMGVGFVRIAATHSAVYRWLEALLLDQPQVQLWNQRKNGRDGMGVTGMGLPMPEPDDDFIDLDAFIRNVAMSLLDEDGKLERPRVTEIHS